MKRSVVIYFLVICIIISACSSQESFRIDLENAVQEIYGASELTGVEKNDLINNDQISDNNRYFRLNRLQLNTYNKKHERKIDPDNVSGLWIYSLEEGDVGQYYQGDSYSLSIISTEFVTTAIADNRFEDIDIPSFMTDFPASNITQFEDETVKEYYQEYRGGSSPWLVTCYIVILGDNTLTEITLMYSSDCEDYVKDDFISLCEAVDIPDPYPEVQDKVQEDLPDISLGYGIADADYIPIIIQPSSYGMPDIEISEDSTVLRIVDEQHDLLRGAVQDVCDELDAEYPDDVIYELYRADSCLLSFGAIVDSQSITLGFTFDMSGNRLCLSDLLIATPDDLMDGLKSDFVYYDEDTCEYSYWDAPALSELDSNTNWHIDSNSIKLDYEGHLFSIPLYGNEEILSSACYSSGESFSTLVSGDLHLLNGQILNIYIGYASTQLTEYNVPITIIDGTIQDLAPQGLQTEAGIDYVSVYIDSDGNEFLWIHFNSLSGTANYNACYLICDEGFNQTYSDTEYFDHVNDPGDISPYKVI